MIGDRQRVDLHPPREVVWIARELEKAGHEVWAVGGAVRDALSGSSPEDWDLTTSARPVDVQRVFRRTVPIGIDHGTVGVIGRSGKMYEVTTFRRDVETFGRKARVVFADDLDEDLQRRDFTINAVAWHPVTHEVRDPHHGMQDLSRGILRTVGDPELRFAEDRLRVLRALRFAGRFKLRIDPPTMAGVEASSGRLGALSAERIREELWKVMAIRDSPAAALRLYEQSGVLASLYPEIAGVVGRWSDELGSDVWEYVLRAVDAASARTPRVRLACLVHGWAYVPQSNGDPAAAAAAAAGTARQLLRRLRSSNADTDAITHLIAQHRVHPDQEAADPEIRRWVRRVGREYLNDVLRLLFASARARRNTEDALRLLGLARRARRVARSSAAFTVQDLAIDGNDLRVLGIPPGPSYGFILRLLLERVTDDPDSNEKEALIELATEVAEEEGIL